MTRRLFSHDPHRGVTEYFHYDESTDTFQIEAVQDVEPIVDANKRKFNEFTSGRDKWADMELVAHIPNVILEGLMREGKLRDQAYMKRWLNDPDNRFFRTRPGVV